MANGEHQESTVQEQVLLVDDDGNNLEILCETLADREYRLLVARSGPDALKVAKKVQPDLVLLDIQPVGSGRMKKVDARIIAATNRDLARRVNEDQFRMDLYYRLNVFPLLADTFLKNLAVKLGKPFEAVSREGMELLMHYDWPGNIRELQNVMERVAILAQRPPVVDISDAHIPAGPQQPSLPAEEEETDHRTLADCERWHIRRILDEVDRVIAGKQGAAEIPGVPPSTLRSRMKKLGIGRS